MTTATSEKARTRLTNVDRGFAEVDLYLGDRYIAALGRVEQHMTLTSGAKWYAFTNRGDRVGIRFAVRDGAVTALRRKFVNSVSPRQRRYLGLTLKEDG